MEQKQDFNQAATSQVKVNKFEVGEVEAREDCVAEEVPIAMVYNGISHAVMLATPQDLEDFALGFSLAEGILSSKKELYGVEVVPKENGIELQIEIAADRFYTLKEKRRSMAGRTGCGLCGADSLEQALRIPTQVVNTHYHFDSTAIHTAHQQIKQHQTLQAVTGATHASAWVNADGTVALIREDVGRHNALDKLIGAMVSAGVGLEGFVLTTSRASYEMVQKTVTLGASMLVAISAPTGLAIRIAEQCGLTLVGFARKQQYVVYSHPERILLHQETVA